MTELSNKQLFKLRMDTSRMFPYSIVRLCLVLPIRQNVNISGLVTLGKDFIGFAKEFQDLDYVTMKDVLAHSIIYYQFKHYKRGKSFITDKISKVIWNIASEICRSSFLNNYVKTGYKESNKNFLEVGDWQFAAPENFGLPDNLSVEQYYEILYNQYLDNKNLLEQYKTGSEIEYDGNGEGIGAKGDSTQEGAETSDFEAVKGSGELEPDQERTAGQFDVESQIQIESIQTIKNALSILSRGFNSLHGELQYFSESPEARDKKKINRLRKLLNTCIHNGPGRRINGPRPRKRVPVSSNIKIMEEVKIGFKPIAVIVDVSGSTEAFRDQIYDMLALTIRATNLIDVYIGDVTVLTSKKKVTRSKQVNAFPEGGGTDMAAIMLQLDNMNKYRAIIVITDGLTPWPESPLKAKCFVCLLGDAYGAEADVPTWINLI